MKKKRRILSTFLAACMVTTCMAGMSVPASADGETSTYSITIPPTLDVSGAGYTQLTGGITATGSNISGKLTVSAESAHTWNLQETTDSSKKVPYKLTSNSTGDPTEKTKWEFTPTDGTINGSENVYVYIAETDYNNAAAGTYTDTVTFTASVGAAAPLYYDKAVQVYQYDNPGYRDYVYAGNYKTLSADEGYALAQYFASVNSCSVCVITDWIDSSGQMKYVTNSSSAEQQSIPSFFRRYDRVYLVPKN